MYVSLFEGVDKASFQLGDYLRRFMNVVGECSNLFLVLLNEVLVVVESIKPCLVFFFKAVNRLRNARFGSRNSLFDRTVLRG